MEDALKELPVLGNLESIERDRFLRLLLRHLAGSLEEVIGLKEAEGFISLVGRRIGDDVFNTYLGMLGDDPGAEGVARALVDFKERIGGDFYLIEVAGDSIVLGNRRCPFGDMVRDRRSLCGMTTNVFGVVAAQSMGVAEVEIEDAIARGDRECRVVIRLGSAAESGAGRVFYRA